MATKTSSKIAMRKPTAKPFGSGRKTAAPQKRDDVAAKTKLPKKGLGKDVAGVDAAASAKPSTTQREKPEPAVSAQATPHPETVSLIDRKRPAKKSQDSEIKTKRAVLPPISRIRASLDTTAKVAPPSPPDQAPSPQPAPAEPAEKPSDEAPSASAELEPGPEQKVLLIKPPIVVKQFATELGLKPHQLIA